MCPQAEHLFNAVTSFIAFPASSLDRFFECEVFFFGTAFNIDSHNPSMNPGTFNEIAEGMPIERDGRRGCESCREKRAVNREALVTVGAENPGRKEDRIDEVVT